MKLVIQRVIKGSVTVDNQIIGQVNKGFVVLVGFKKEDQVSCILPMAQKLINLRIISDENGKMNLALKDVKGEILLIPQFTLYADTSSRRPGFTPAAIPEIATKLFDAFVNEVKNSGLKVETGKFGADMLVEIYNDGPVTIILDN
jgi:D-tyrosyl-tRNA(Tyr) deacylase